MNSIKSCFPPNHPGVSVYWTKPDYWKSSSLELTALKGVDRVQGVKHKDNFYHTLTVLDTLSLYSQDLWLRWAALLHDIGKPATKKYIQGQGWTFYGHNHVGERLVGKIFNRLKLPQNEKMSMIQKLVICTCVLSFCRKKP